MSDHRLDADVRAKGFAIRLEDGARRLDFRHLEADKLDGRAGTLHYGGADVQIEGLTTSLDHTHWATESTACSRAWMRSEHGSFTMTAERFEMPRGMQLTKSAGGGLELISPHVSLSDVGFEISHVEPTQLASQLESPAVKQFTSGRMQDRLRFLDALHGTLKMTLQVELELPVLGMRTLDQKLDVPIRDGSLDFRALEASLRWLEGAFLDLSLDNDALALRFGVPMLARTSREIIAWHLDPDAQSLAAFGRIPLRCLGDFRRAPDHDDDAKKKRSSLRSLKMSDIKVDLSLTAPRALELGDGALLFGGDNEPGLVDVHLDGFLFHPPAAGLIRGDIGLFDVTAKDVPLGSARVSVDRFHIGRIDSLECKFDGFAPKSIIATMARATATNLCLVI